MVKKEIVQLLYLQGRSLLFGCYFVKIIVKKRDYSIYKGTLMRETAKKRKNMRVVFFFTEIIFYVKCNACPSQPDMCGPLAVISYFE